MKQSNSARARVGSFAAGLLALAVLVGTGCAVTRGQSSLGEYVDDVGITTAVKSLFIESRAVDAGAISVETLNGEVQLTGFARSATERSEAERLARGVKGVKGVQNRIAVRP